MVSRACVITVSMALCAGACGGSPTGPATTSSGTITFDGQTYQGTPEGTGAFSRLPSLDWVDFTISRCSSPPAIAFTLKGVTTPPATGTYTVRSDTDLLSTNATIGGQQWRAGNFVMNQYCGDGFGGGVLPACTPDSAGAGSMTISAASSNRVSGSYRFVLVLPDNFSGFLRDRPPPVTKVVEGVFDLEFDNRVFCP
jgi:hypothetical protein